MTMKNRVLQVATRITSLMCKDINVFLIKKEFMPFPIRWEKKKSVINHLDLFYWHPNCSECKETNQLATCATIRPSAKESWKSRIENGLKIDKRQKEFSLCLLGYLLAQQHHHFTARYIFPFTLHSTGILAAITRSMIPNPSLALLRDLCPYYPQRAALQMVRVD